MRKKHSYLHAQFQRLRARRGPRKAICAVAASILTAAYHMLGDGTFYADPGPDHFRKDRAHDPRKGTCKTDRTPRLHMLDLTAVPLSI